MININTLKNRVHDVINKAQTGAGLKPDLFNRLVNPGIYWVLRRHIGLPEQYSPGQPIPAMAYEQTQVITNGLADIKVSDTPLTVLGGKATIPPDYYYPSVLYHKMDIEVGVDRLYSKFKRLDCSAEQTKNISPVKKSKYEYMAIPIDILTTKERIYSSASVTRIPTKKYPIASFDFPNLSIEPLTISKAYFTYLRRPRVALWNYTIVNNVEVYNPIGSQDVELPIELMDMLMAKIVTDLGYRTRETELYGIGGKITQTGA